MVGKPPGGKLCLRHWGIVILSSRVGLGEKPLRESCSPVVRHRVARAGQRDDDLVVQHFNMESLTRGSSFVLNLTPGASPLVNSTPAYSTARSARSRTVQSSNPRGALIAQESAISRGRELLGRPDVTPRTVTSVGNYAITISWNAWRQRHRNWSRGWGCRRLVR